MDTFVQPKNVSLRLLFHNLLSNVRTFCLLEIPAGPSRVFGSAHFVTWFSLIRCLVGLR